MKKAKTLAIVGCVIRLVSACFLLIAFFLLLKENQSSYRGTDYASLSYGTKSSNAPIGVVMVVLASILLLVSIINLICVGCIKHRAACIVLMVTGILTVPVGLFDFFGGKVGLSANAEMARENYGEEAAARIAHQNKLIGKAFIGVLITLAIASGLFAFMNMNSDMFRNSLFNFEHMSSSYAAKLFGSALAESEEAKSIANLSLMTLIPLILGYAYSAFLGCCPSFSWRHRGIKTIVYAISYVACAVIYIVFLTRFFSLFSALETKGLEGNVTIKKLTAMLSPLVSVAAYSVPMFLMASLPGWIVCLIAKMRHKHPKEGFNFLAAILTLAIALGGFALSGGALFAVLDLVEKIIDAIAKLISFLIGCALLFALICFVGGFFPQRVTRFTFSDGSYYEVEQYGSGPTSYGEGKWHNSDGSYRASDNGDYFSSDEMSKMDDYVDRH